MGSSLNDGSGWIASLIFWAISGVVNGFILWLVINVILGRRGEASFVKCIGCSMLISVAGGVGLFIGQIVGVIAGMVIGGPLALFVHPALGGVAMVIVTLGVALGFWWKAAYWAVDTVLDLREGQGRTILVVYIVAALILKVIFVLGLGIGTFGAMMAMNGSSPSSNVTIHEMEMDEEEEPTDGADLSPEEAEMLDKVKQVSDVMGIEKPKPEKPGTSAADPNDPWATGDSSVKTTAAQTSESDSPKSDGDETLEQADALLDQARREWNAGDYAASLASGQKAVNIYKKLLAPDNPILVRARKMNQTAKQRAKTKETP